MSPYSDYPPGLGPRWRAIGPGIWTVEGDQIRFLGFPFALRSTVIALPDGALLVHSPVQLAAAQGVDTLGSVGHIVTPNAFHHRFLGEWAAEYPHAHIYAPPGLRRKRPDLSFAANLGAEAPATWAEVVDQRIVPGSVLSEVVFFHRPSRTLILGDLIENHDPDLLNRLHRWFAAANRVLAPRGSTARFLRPTFWRRKRVREVLREVLAWEPQVVILAHGPCIEDHAVEFLRDSLGWALGVGCFSF
jgi:Domain of unknown function (DUF4336)